MKTGFTDKESKARLFVVSASMQGFLFDICHMFGLKGSYFQKKKKKLITKSKKPTQMNLNLFVHIFQRFKVFYLFFVAKKAQKNIYSRIHN